MRIPIVPTLVLPSPRGDAYLARARLNSKRSTGYDTGTVASGSPPRYVALGPTETQVTLDHLGGKQGPVREQGYQYLDDAWGSVLELHGTRLPMGEHPLTRDGSKLGT